MSPLITYIFGKIALLHAAAALQHHNVPVSLPIVVNTWEFLEANKNAFRKLSSGRSALDAVEIGCQTCQTLQCDGTVGYGGSPDENGETTLDAMIMDGKTMNVGAVGALRNVKNAISVARHVLEYTEHSFLVGQQATEFALAMGFPYESLSTEHSTNLWKRWKENSCQPNFWTNVSPNPKTQCGPYEPVRVIRRKSYDKISLKIVSKAIRDERNVKIDRYNHDTIGMVAIDRNGDVAVATSTNGARSKIPGRVGDSPIIGSGGYAQNGVGAAAATGDGDIIMRFLPSFKAVECLKSGMSPKEAAEESLKPIVNYYPKFSGGVVVVSADGRYGAACLGMKSFPFCVAHGNEKETVVLEVSCLN